jgi:hypothetical protein
MHLPSSFGQTAEESQPRRRPQSPIPIPNSKSTTAPTSTTSTSNVRKAHGHSDPPVLGLVNVQGHSSSTTRPAKPAPAPLRLLSARSNHRLEFAHPEPTTSHTRLTRAQRDGRQFTPRCCNRAKLPRPSPLWPLVGTLQARSETLLLACAPSTTHFFYYYYYY